MNGRALPLPSSWVLASTLLPGLAAGCPGVFELTLEPDPGTSDGGASVDAAQVGQPFRCGARPEVPAPPPGSPRRQIGDGTRDSCTEAALLAAFAQGGIIDLDCGAGLIEIPLTTPLAPTDAPVYLDGEGKLTLSGRGTTPVLALTGRPPEVVLERVSLSRGSADSGGAVRVPDGVRLWLNEVVFTSNEGTGSTSPGSRPAVGGGALHVRPGGEAVVIATNFLNNVASFGGAAFVEGRAGFHGVRFRSNLAAAEGVRTGGALASVGGEVTLCDVVFEDNRAGRGGALYAEESQLEVIGSRFDQNLAVGGDARIGAVGGAMTLVRSTAAVHRASFRDNVAIQGGGAVALDGGAARLVNVVFLDNRVSNGPGGAALVTEGEHAIHHGTFANNSAPQDGTAIAGDPTLTLANGLLTGPAPLCAAMYRGSVVLQTDTAPCTPAASTRADIGLPPTPSRCGLLDALTPDRDSPAHGAGAPELCADEDLCGRPRADGCDVGAVEAD